MMKKLLFSLLFAGSIALTACQATIYTADKTKAKLQKKDYTVEVYTKDEAKNRYTAFTLADYDLTGALLAKKGQGDDADLLFALYFSSIDEASKFSNANGGANIATLGTFGEALIGKNQTSRVGTHNNVAYVGTETTFNIAFK